MKKNDLNQMMQQVQQMQSDMREAQEALAPETVEGTAGGGVVKAVVTGGGELQEIEISPSAVDPEDVEMLQDLVVAAVNEANRRSQELQAERLGNVTGGLDMGDIGGMLGG